MAKTKNPAAVALGRRGGKARMTTMTPEQRSAIARRAALASHGKLPKPIQVWIVLHPTEDNPPIILHSDPDRRKAELWAKRNCPDAFITPLETQVLQCANISVGAVQRVYKPDIGRQVQALRELVEATQER